MWAALRLEEETPSVPETNAQSAKAKDKLDFMKDIFMAGKGKNSDLDSELKSFLAEET